MKTAPIIATILLVSCARLAAPEESALLRTVPSRAIAVMQFSRLEPALGLLFDSTSVFRNIDYGRLDDAGMILSYDYSAGLIPLLAIDAGRSDADTSSAVRKILLQAEELKLNALYTGDLLPKRAALLLSPSRAAIDEALGHIESGVSVLDAPDFGEALSLADGSAGSIILKNANASRWLPAGLLKGQVARKSLAGLVSGAAEWTVLNFKEMSREGISVRCYSGGNRRYLSEFFSTQPAGECKLAGALPDTVDFVLDIPLKDWKMYCDGWKECLDARADLSKYKGKLAGLRKRLGKSPETWLEEMSPAELALVRWNGAEVLLLRREGRRFRTAPLSENPYPGFMPALFGEAFRIADDSFCAASGGWTAFGSEADVSAWLEAGKAGSNAGIPKKAGYIVLNNQFSLMADTDNTILNVK